MRKKRKLEPGGIRRVLVVKLDELGDSVMLTPFIRELRSGLPQAWITLVVKPQLKELWDTCPYVNEVIPYDRQAGLPNLKSRLSAFSFAKKRLWEKRFDLAIVPRWDADAYGASFLAYFSGARHRVGYSEKVIKHKETLNRGYDLLFTSVSADAELKHEAERNLDLLRGIGFRVDCGKTELWASEEDIAVAHRLLASKNIQPTDKLVCLYPSGGSSVLKQWPANNFMALGRWVHETYGMKVLVVGGPGDEGLCREVTKGIGPEAQDICGGVSLRVAAAIFKRCDLFVGNDTGPTHMAAAMGTPVVAIFGASCPHRFAPTGEHCSVIWKNLECSACVQHGHADRCATCVYGKPECLVAVTLDDVKRAVQGFMKEQV